VIGMASRSKDWFAQAERDLEQARESRASRRHERACFASHQAAEKALKALHLSLRQEAWGHVIAKLLYELPGEIPEDTTLVDKAHVLDSYYVASRYPYGPRRRGPIRALRRTPERGGDSLCR